MEGPPRSQLASSLETCLGLKSINQVVEALARAEGEGVLDEPAMVVIRFGHGQVQIEITSPHRRNDCFKAGRCPPRFESGDG